MNAHRSAPELILLFDHCHTFAKRLPLVRGLAVAEGRVIALGTRRAVLSLRGRGTRVVDCAETTVTPGLVDCHTHFFYWALGRSLVVDLSTLHSRDAVLRAIHTFARQRPDNDWIVARGFDYNRWDAGLPSAADLDRVVSDRAVIAHSRDGHSAWLNTAALQQVGISARTPDPKGGRYLRDARGRPTGIVQETAVDLLPDPVRDFARRRDAGALRVIDAALDDAFRIAQQHGLVGVHSMDDGTSLSHLLRLHDTGKLALRVLHAVPLAELGRAVELGLRSGFGDEWLRLGGIKMFADGALGSQTAYMYDAYPGRRGYHGVPNVAGDALRDAVCQAAQCGWAAWIHAIGDRAVHDAVAAIAAASRAGRPVLPHRIEHAQCVRPRDVRRMAQLGVIASVQPCHLLGDIVTADRHWPRARRNAYPLRRMLTAGVTLAAGSDVPIESLDPRRSLYAAVVRANEQGQPTGGWFPGERISAADTLRAFTRGAAIAARGHALAGTIALGAPADLTIWREDPLRVAPQALLEIGIPGCVVGGQVHLNDDA